MDELSPVKSGKVKVDDVNLYYEIYGQGDPLVLVAGTGISLAPWRVSQVPEFARHYQVFIYDHRGLGRSESRTCRRHADVRQRLCRFDGCSRHP